MIYAIAWDNVATTPPESCRYNACFVTDQDVTDTVVLQGTLPGELQEGEGDEE